MRTGGFFGSWRAASTQTGTWSSEAVSCSSAVWWVRPRWESPGMKASRSRPIFASASPRAVTTQASSVTVGSSAIHPASKAGV